MRVVYWGTYDTGKPRTRILIRGLRENGLEVIECHADVWGGIEDKSQVSSWLKRFHLLFRWLSSYPLLVLRYLRLPKHDVVIIGYMGQLDVLVMWPFAKLRGVPVVWDAFLSLYDTVVEDRNLIGPKHALAKLLFFWEYLSCRAADLIVLDTQAHAGYFTEKFKITGKLIDAVLVGVESDTFPIRPQSSKRVRSNGGLTVLFYGQFIPLHGIETIILAARRAANTPLQWVLIGKGQEESKIRSMLDDHPLPRLKWLPWVPYEELIRWIHRSDICLGIFGNSGKAGRVIPNKVFQILSTGTPLITRDSPAIRELLSPEMPGVFLIPPSDSDALLEALRSFHKQRPKLIGKALYRNVMKDIEPFSIGKKLVGLMGGLQKTFTDARNAQA
ncbi:MAG TPA: glycosyltransferase [Desulfatiglandales bacterium]|nr:glycosyltransferase [Desulfatiglandales bacterium]